MPASRSPHDLSARLLRRGAGIAVAKRADGKIKVLGDPDHPVSRVPSAASVPIAYNGACSTQRSV